MKSSWHDHILLQWHHNERDGVSNHQPHDCLLKRLSRRISKKTSKLRVTGLCAGNSPMTGEFPAERSSNTENVPIWRRHHASWSNQTGCDIPGSLDYRYFDATHPRSIDFCGQTRAVSYYILRMNLFKIKATMMFVGKQKVATCKGSLDLLFCLLKLLHW